MAYPGVGEVMKFATARHSQNRQICSPHIGVRQAITVVIELLHMHTNEIGDPSHNCRAGYCVTRSVLQKGALLVYLRILPSTIRQIPSGLASLSSSGRALSGNPW